MAENGNGSPEGRGETERDTTASVGELLEVVARREDFLSELRDGPLYKRDLIDALDTSRSTVDRAMRELTDAGFAERVDEGFVATPTGALAVERYHEYTADVADVFGASEALEPLPPGRCPSTSMIAGADIRLASVPRPYRALDPVREAIGDTDHLQAVLPNIADSEHLRRYRDRAVEAGATVELVCAPELYDALRERFPELLRELVVEGDARIYTGEVPPYATLVAESDGDATTSVVVYSDPGSVHAALHNDTAAAVRWARAAFERHRADGDEVSEEIRSLSSSDREGDGESSGRPVPGRAAATATGRHEASPPTRPEPNDPGGGFVRLTPDYFQRRTPAPPERCWRTGLGLPEVAAGYAVERERPTGDGRERLTEGLLARLRDGTDQVVLGPPGAGKSTVCKLVACRWYERGYGPVLYRRSGRGESFDDPASLRAALQTADGHALVVVEDAVRAEANDVFEVAAGFDGAADVTFLCDARTGEWEDPDAFPADAELDAVRAAFEPCHLPRVDERECERFVDRFEETVGETVPVEATDLLAEIRSGAEERSGPDTGAGAEADDPRPGETLLLFHRLATYASPLAGNETTTSTTLDEDVQRLYHDLAAADSELPLEVGILVNLLNAAGLGVPPAYVHALAGEGQHRVVNETLDRLEGQVLFPTASSDGYRTIHEAWSVRFLEHLLAERSPAAAHRRIGECLSAVLSLTDPECREHVEWVLEGETDALSGPAEQPGAWAERLVTQVFELGLERPKLAPLFGKAGYGSITLPEAAPASLDRDCIEWRGRMYLSGYYLDRAEHEFEALAEQSGSVEEGPARERLLATSLEGRGRVALERGDTGIAAELLGRALGRYRTLEDDHGVADCLLELGNVAREGGDYRDAPAYYRRALRQYQAIGSVSGRGRALRGFGMVFQERGRDERSAAYHEAALELFQGVGDRVRRARCLLSLGITSKKTEDFETGRSQYKRALELFREVGNRHGEAACLTNLGEIARKEEEYDDAERYQRESLRVYREMGDQRSTAIALNNLGIIAEEQGDLEAAERHQREALDLRQELGNDQDIAFSLHNLGVLAKDRERYEVARDRLEESLATLERLGDDRSVAITRIELGEVAEGRGALDRARDQYERALETARDADLPRTSLDALDRLVDFHAGRGERRAAVDRCRTAVELAAEADLPDRRETFEGRLESLLDEPTVD